MGNTRQYITAHSTPKDLETMFQMMYYYFTAVKKDEIRKHTEALPLFLFFNISVKSAAYNLPH